MVTSGTDSDGRPGEVRASWLTDPELKSRVTAPGWRENAPTHERRAVIAYPPTPAPDGHPGVVVVHTGETGREEPEWYGHALVAAGRVARRSRARHLAKRARPLLVTPMLGTGGGGAGRRRTGVMAAVLTAAREVAAGGWDVALVVQDAASFSAAQLLRTRGTTWRLRKQEEVVLTALADAARAGRLVPFVGAGVSASAGLPGWKELLADLGSEVRLGSGRDRKALSSMDPRDAAMVLQRRLARTDEDLDSALRRRFDRADRPALTHALLGSLPIREAATTNYDRLFELAWAKGAGEKVSVLPRDDGSTAQRWLLKLHGDVDNPNRKLVLSREQYRQLETESGAVGAVMQALLLTRHLLIVGYGLNDETFHRIAHEVRQVRQIPLQPNSGRPALGGLGTALLVKKPDLAKEVWNDDLSLVDLTRRGDSDAAGARRLEIFLDRLAHLAAPVESYVLGAGWTHLTAEGPLQELRTHLQDIESIDGLPHPLRRAVEETLIRFGWSGPRPRKRGA